MARNKIKTNIIKFEEAYPQYEPISVYSNYLNPNLSLLYILTENELEILTESSMNIYMEY